MAFFAFLLCLLSLTIKIDSQNLKLITKTYEVINLNIGQPIELDHLGFAAIHECPSHIGLVSPIVSEKREFGFRLVFNVFNYTFNVKTIYISKPNVLNDVSVFDVYGENSVETKVLNITELRFFTGRVEGRHDCDVNGYVSNGNLSKVRAIISCPLDDFYLEPTIPAVEYHGLNCSSFTSIVYRKSDALQDVCSNVKGNVTGQCLFYEAKGKRVNLDISERAKNSNLTNRARRQDYRHRVCGIHIIADHTFYRFYGNTESLVLQEMTAVFQESDRIYRATDFNGDGKGDGIGLKINKISIFRDDNSPYFLREEGIPSDAVLDAISSWAASENDFCLTVVFTHRDYSPEQTIGLAWVGKPNKRFGVGGLCDTVQNVRNKGKVRMNTGMVTNVNGQNILPTAIFTITFAHEVGHSFGAEHDKDRCAWSNPDKNYIMFPSANIPKTRRNKMFSPCSINMMLPVIRNKGSCLEVDEGVQCGDGVLQPESEECDCGASPEQCEILDPCCVPAQSRIEQPCRFARSRGAQCSPAKNPCCDRNCRFSRAGKSCSTARNECTLDGICNGVNSKCEESTAVGDGTPCEGTSQVCFHGSCDRTICALVQLGDCECKAPESEICSVCCINPDGRCVPADKIGLVTPTNKRFLRLPGTPCNQGTGVCTAKGTCGKKLCPLVAADEGLLLGTSGETWVANNWYYIFLGLVALLLMAGMATGVYFVGKHRKKLKNMRSNVKTTTAVIAENPNWKKLSRHTQTQVARLKVFFPSVSIDELIVVAEEGRSEQHMINQLLSKGHPMKKMFKEKDKPKEKNDEKSFRTQHKSSTKESKSPEDRKP